MIWLYLHNHSSNLTFKNVMLEKSIQKIERNIFDLVDKFVKINKHYFFTTIVFITIFPFFLLSLFNNPASDDFAYCNESQVRSLFDFQKYLYFEWSGRYFSNFLLSFIEPLVYKQFYWYKLIPTVLIILFIFSIFSFLTALKLKTSTLEKISLVGFFLFLYIYQMPDVYQGFYWIPGLLTYQLSQVSVLFFFIFLLKYSQNKKGIYLLISSFFLFAAIGSNEITAVSLLFIISLMLLYNYFVFNKFNKPLFYILILAICFVSIAVLAPGNAIRAEQIKIKHQLFYSLFRSFQLSISLLFKWMPIITICCLFFLNKIMQIIEERINVQYIIHPFFSFFILFMLVFLSVFACFWSTNILPPNRTLNTIYFFFIITFIYFIISVIYHYLVLKKLDFRYSNSVKTCMGIIIVLCLFSTNNITLAYYELVSGKAYKYNREMATRFELIENSKEVEIVLPTLINKPQTMYSSEMGITNDKNNWKNIAISRYFRKKSILVEPTDLYTE